MAPPLANEAISTPQEPLLFLEVADGGQLVTQCFHFFPCLLRGLQGAASRSLISDFLVEQSFLNFLEHLHFVLRRLLVQFAFSLVNEGAARHFFQSGHAVSFL